MSLVSFVKIPQDTDFQYKQAITESLNLIDYKFNPNHQKSRH